MGGTRILLLYTAAAMLATCRESQVRDREHCLAPVEGQAGAFRRSLAVLDHTILEAAAASALEFHTAMEDLQRSAPDSAEALSRDISDGALGRLKVLGDRPHLALVGVTLQRYHARFRARVPIEAIAGAAQLLAEVREGRAAVDSGFAVIAQVVSTADSIEPEDSGPLLFTTVPWGSSSDAEPEWAPLPGGRALLCVLAELPQQVSSPESPDYEYVRARGAANLLMWLERADRSWSREASDSVVVRWFPVGARARLRGILQDLRRQAGGA